MQSHIESSPEKSSSPENSSSFPPLDNKTIKPKNVKDIRYLDKLLKEDWLKKYFNQENQ